MKKVSLSDNTLSIQFDYNPQIVSGVKTIPGRRWNGERKLWEIELKKDSSQPTLDFFQEFEFPVEKEILDKIKIFCNGKKENPYKIKLEGIRLSFLFPYNPSIINDIKLIDGKKFNPISKIWTVVLDRISYKKVQDFISKYPEFEIDNGVFELIKKIEKEVEDYVKSVSKNIELSGSYDTDFDVTGLNEGCVLRPFQKVGVEYAVKNKKIIIGDEMGLGKTVMALASIRYMNLTPTLVICPNSLKYNWKREFEKWTQYKVCVIDSNTVLSNDFDVMVINYDIVKKQSENLGKMGFKAIIMDESHYLKSRKAQRTEAVRKLTKGIDYLIMLTGTVILNRPIELTSQLEILSKLDSFGGWWKFAQRYCDAHRSRFGLDVSGAKNLDELHTKLRATCYIRRNKSEVLKELPAKQRCSITLPITNQSEYKKAEADVINYLRNESNVAVDFEQSISHLSEEEQREARKAQREQRAAAAERAEHLVKINMLKQLSVKGKMKAAIEWVQDFLESGEKLVLFAYHRETIDELSKTFNCDKIDGSVSAEERQKVVDRFQNDPNVKLIVLNLKAGSVGLTLTASSNVAFLEYGWTPAEHDQGEDRVHRIGQDNSVMAWYLSGENTIDHDIHDLIEEKRFITNAVNKGEFVEGDSMKIMNELISKLLNK